jgi:hypothetical protein
MKVTREVFGDPCPGKRKDLLILSSDDTLSQVKEGNFLFCPSLKTIKRVFWGSGQYFVDVTDAFHRLRGEDCLREERILNFDSIVVYFHICQLGEWRRSFDIIWEALKESGLYDCIQTIRVGLAFDEEMEEDYRLLDKKISIVSKGKCREYERITLHHMKQASYVDSEMTRYVYLHTKGIKHWGTERDGYIKKWIDVMVQSVIYNWRWANTILLSLNARVYGSMYFSTSRSIKPHYSGNFWWTTAQHIRELPMKIGEGYVDPEMWILATKNIVIANTFPHYRAYQEFPPDAEHKVEIINVR